MSRDADKHETEQEIEARVRIEEACKEIGESLAEAMPSTIGFALLMFDFGEKGSLAYCSNAMREDVVAMLHEWLGRQEQS